MSEPSVPARRPASDPMIYFEQPDRASLGRRAARGGAVMLSAQGLRFVLQFGSMMILGRLLVPEDFGVIALATTLLGLISVIKDGSFGPAVVQRSEITPGDVSTLFWINALLGLLLTFLTIAAAGPVAAFFEAPYVEPVLIAMSANTLFMSLSAQHLALLQRRLRFGVIAAIELATMVVGTGGAIVLAFLFESVWALTVPPISQAVLPYIAVRLVCRWQPGRPQHPRTVLPYLSFGSFASVAAVLSYFGNSFDQWVIGWRFNAETLGPYTRAYGLLTLPVRQANRPLSSVAVPALSRVLDDPVRYRALFARPMTMLLCVTMPGFAFVGYFGPEVIYVVLGPGWELAGELFRILAVAGLVLPYWNATSWLWLSQGRMREHMYFHMIDFPTKIAAILVGVQYGVEGVAWAVAFRPYLLLPVLFWMIARGTPLVSTRFLYALMLQPMVSAGVVLGACFAADAAWPSASAIPLLLQAGVVSAAAWAVSLCVLPQGRVVIGSYLQVVKHLRTRQPTAARGDPGDAA